MEFSEILRVAGGFLITVAILFGGAVFIRKYGLFGVPTTGPAKRLKLVESLSLDPKRRVVLLRCDDQEHLILIGERETTLSTQTAKQPMSDTTKTDMTS